MFGDMVYFKNGWYTNSPKGCGVGTSSTQMLHGVEFDVKPLKDRRFEVEWRCDSGNRYEEKKSNGLYMYAVGSHEYQVVYMTLDITYANVGMLDGVDRGLNTVLFIFVDPDYSMGRSITVIAMVSITYRYWCLDERGPQSKVPTLVEADVYRRRLTITIKVENVKIFACNI
ncbi:hypothetical protein Tco_0897409 [Tanacetum coccineum]